MPKIGRSCAARDGTQETVGPIGPARHQRTPAGWARALARTTGRQPATHEAEIHGRDALQDRLADSITAMARAGYWRGVAKALAPIRAALHAAVRGAGESVLCRDLVRRAQIADATEEVAESTYLVDPTPANARAWRQALEEQMAMDVLIHTVLRTAEG